MPEKTRSSFMDPLTFPNFAPPFDTSALFAMYQRNVEAMTRSAAKISEAMISVGNAQMAMWRSLADVRSSAPTPTKSSPMGLSEAFQDQMSNGRSAVEKAVEQMRAVNDTVRECCYDVVKEFENCTSDNLKGSNSSSNTHYH